MLSKDVILKPKTIWRRTIEKTLEGKRYDILTATKIAQNKKNTPKDLLKQN